MVNQQEVETNLSVAGSATTPKLHPDVEASGVAKIHEQLTTEQALINAQEKGAPIFPAKESVPVLTKPSEHIGTTDLSATPAWEKIKIRLEQEREEKNAA